MAAKAKKKPSESRQVTKLRKPGRPKDADRIPKALTQEQLTVLKVMGITPGQLGLADVKELEGPSPATLEGTPLAGMAEWLGTFERLAAEDKDGQGDEYRKRAGQVRWMIWKRKYKL